MDGGSWHCTGGRAGQWKGWKARYRSLDSEIKRKREINPMMFLLKNNSILLIILTPKKASRVSVWQNGHYAFMRVRQKKTEVKVKVTQSCLTLCDPGQNTGVGSLSLLQGIFPTQKSNRGLPHCRWVLYQVSHQESPRILEWVAYPFSSRFSWPRNKTRVSCIAGRFFPNWAMREALTEQN